MTTFILGSKPNPIIPEAKATNIISANNSYLFYHEKISIKKENLTLVFEPSMFLNIDELYVPDFEIKNFLFNRKLVKNLSANQIYIRPPFDKKFYFKNYTYQGLPIQKNLNFITYSDLTNLVKKYFEINFIKLLKFFFSKLFMKKKKISSLKKIIFHQLPFFTEYKISTGLLALLIAIDNKNYTPPYYVVGIGVESDGYTYMKDQEMLRENHLKADLELIKLLKKKNLDIRFTDKNLSKIYNLSN